MTKKVMVLMGGFSSEREVSIESGKGVVKALKSKGYNVIKHTLSDTKKFIKALNTHKPDVVFNALHGNWGEDGTIPALLDLLQIPYTHSGMLASSVGMNKYITKLIAEKLGIKTAPGERLTFAEFKKKTSSFKMPFVVKPMSDGSSVGVYIIKNKEDLKKVKYDSPSAELLVERYIEGRELTVMCYRGKAYVVTELDAKKGFYDYKHKYTSGATNHILPADLPENVKKTCLSYAEKIHAALKCKTVSRSDLRYNAKDGVIFLEINTHPGLTSLSLVPEQAKYIGISYEDLCQNLVEEASCRLR